MGHETTKEITKRNIVRSNENKHEQNKDGEWGSTIDGTNAAKEQTQGNEEGSNDAYISSTLAVANSGLQKGWIWFELNDAILRLK